MRITFIFIALLLSAMTSWGAPLAPPQVTGVSASNMIYYDKVRITWNAANDATAYDVYRATSSTVLGTLIASNLTGLSYDDSPPLNRFYYYAVIAKNAAGSAPKSVAVLGRLNYFPTIVDLVANHGAVLNTVDLNWGSVAGATSYKVYRTDSPGGESTLIGTASDPSFTDATTSASTYYYYTVTAVAGVNEGFASNEAAFGTSPFPAPTMAVSASQGTLYDKISITWPASGLASGYDLYRSDSSGSRGSQIGSDLPGTSFDDTSVRGAVYYYYSVVAKNAAGSAPDSWQAVGWRKIPDSVDTLTASQGSVLNTAQLTWGGVADATGYKIYRATTSGGALMLIGTATGATYTDSTTSTNTYYFYKVSAVVGSQ